MKSFATRFRRQTLGLAEREPSPDFVQRVMAAIGQEFGGRDHSTIVYANSQVEKQMASDRKYKETIEDIIKNIRN